MTFNSAKFTAFVNKSLVKPGLLRPLVPGIFVGQLLTEDEADAIARWAKQCPGWTDWTRPETFQTPGIQAAYGEGYDLKTHITKRRYDDLPFGNIPKSHFNRRLWDSMCNSSLKSLVQTVGFHPVRWLDPFITRFVRDKKGSRTYVPTHRDGHCTLSMCVQLPEAGGGTYFPNIKLFVEDKLGQVLLFGGNNYYGRKMDYMAHRTMPVHRGVRLSLICFFENMAHTAP